MRTLGPSLELLQSACLLQESRKGWSCKEPESSLALCDRGVIAGQSEKGQKSKLGSSQCLLWGLLAKKSTTKQPTEQTNNKKTPSSSFPSSQEEPWVNLVSVGYGLTALNFCLEPWPEISIF